MLDLDTNLYWQVDRIKGERGTEIDQNMSISAAEAEAYRATVKKIAVDQYENYPWPNYDLRVISAETIRSFDDYWQDALVDFTRVYGEYLPDQVKFLDKARIHEWWMKSESFLPSAIANTVKLGPVDPGDMDLVLRCDALLDETLQLVGQLEQCLAKREVANASAAQLALDLKDYLLKDAAFRKDVENGKWSASFVEAVHAYLASCKDVMIADDRSSSLIGMLSVEFHNGEQAGQISEAARAAYVSASPMFTNSGAPVDVTYPPARTMHAADHMREASTILHARPMALERTAFERDMQAAISTLHRERTICEAALARAKREETQIELERAKHSDSTELAKARMLLACRRDGALNYAERAAQQDQTILILMQEICRNIVQIQKGMLTIYDLDLPFANELEDQIKVREVGTDAATVQQVKRWCLDAAFQSLRAHKRDRVVPIARSLTAAELTRLRQAGSVSVSIDEGLLGKVYTARLIDCSISAQYASDDYCRAILLPPRKGIYQHPNSPAVTVDQSNAAACLAGVPTGNNRLVQPGFTATHLLNMAPFGDWTVQLSDTASGKKPASLQGLTILLRVAVRDPA